MADSKLALLITANDQASKALDNLNKKMKNLEKAAAMMGKAMIAGGAAIVGTAVLSVKAYADMGDEVQKMALRTGWATETLSELRHVANITGTELSAFEMGSRRMAGAIEDANDGLATYTRAFEKMGVDYRQLKESSPEEAFWKISEALSNVDNELEKAAIAQDIFGRTGTQLLPMLAEGADGIRKLREEAHELGIVFDQEAADKAAKFKDSLSRLSSAIDGIKNKIGEALIPVFQDYIDVATNAAKTLSNFAEENKNVTGVLTKFGLNIGVVSGGLGTLAIVGPKLGGVFKNLNSTLTKGNMSMGKMGGIMAGLTVGFSMMAFGITELIKNKQTEALVTEHQLKVTEALTEAQNGNTDALYDAITAAKEAGMAIDEQTQAWYEGQAALKKYDKDYAEYIEKVKEAEEAEKQLRREIELRNKAMFSGALQNAFPGGIPEGDLVSIARDYYGYKGNPYDKYASGGPINEPTLLYGMSSRRVYAMAGESGPERVVSGRGGQTLHLTLEIGNAIKDYIVEDINNDVRIRAR